MASDRPKGRTSEVGHLDLKIGRRNHRSLGLGQTGTAGQPENMAGATGDLVTVSPQAFLRLSYFLL